MKRENKKEEVSLLSGILYYFKKMGRYPFENLVTVNHFICTLPYIRGTPTEVRSKIQKLRKKYKKLWKKHGDKLMIMDPLCNEALQLWKEIWGKKPTNDQQQQQPDIDLSEQPDMDLSMFPFLRESMQSDHANPSLKVLPQTIVSEALAQLESSEMQQFDEEWREIQRKEMELYWRRVSIIKDPLCNEAFQLWKEIWGKKPTGDQQQQQPDMELSEQPDMDLSMFPFLRESMQSDHANPLKVLPQTIVSEALAQLESSEMQQFDGEWREIQRKEMELYWRRVSIIKNQTQRLLDLVPNHQTQGDDEPVDDQDPDEV